MSAAARCALPALLALLLIPAAAAAEEPAPGPETVESPAFVRVDGRPLFRVTHFPHETAEARARAIAGRIARAASDPTFSSDSLRIETVELGERLSANGELLLVVTDPDAATGGVSRSQYAEVVRIVVKRTIDAYRAEREPARLVRSGGVAFGAAVLAFLLFVALGWARRALDRWIVRELREKARSVRIQSVELVRTDHISNVVNGLVGLAFLAAHLLVLVLFLQVALRRFPWTRELGEGLLALILTPLQTIGSAFLFHLPGLVFIAVIALVTYLLLGMLRLIAGAMDRGAIRIRGFDAEWAWPTHRIVRVVVIAMAVVVAYPYIPGSQSDAFKGVSLMIGVLVSLGSSSIVSNVIAGYSMIYRRAFHVGDLIRVDDTLGVVENVRTLVTHLRTPKNEEVVLPNSLILNSKVINYSSLARDKGLVLHTTVGIRYEVPWRQVEGMLLLAAERCPGLKKDPPPFVLQRALGDFAVAYELNAYTENPRTMFAQYSELHRHVLDVFNEYGVQIMTPAYEGDPEAPKVVARERWFDAPARGPETRTPADR